jgi:hypothetical protein
MAQHGLRNTAPTGLVERPLLGNGHDGCGGRSGETGWSQGWHRAPGRPYRQQVDLEALTVELLAVVEETMQPTQASLWLRPPQAPSTAAGAVVARQRT